MAAIRGFAIDLEGVVYSGGAALPGAIDAIRRLQALGVPYRFVTNTTSKPRARAVARLAAVGLDAPPHHVFTPAMAARAHIEKHRLLPHYLVAKALMEDFAGLRTGNKPAVVIGDARDGFTYASLNAMFRLIEDGAELIALATNRKFRDADGGMSMDVGAFVAALEFASARTATVLGKPAPAFFRLAVDAMGLRPHEVAMIGDDAEFDASAAVRAGLQGIVVRTGKWSPGASDGLDPPPTAEFADLGEAVDRLAG